MAEKDNNMEYDQYAPGQTGRLFSSAMFGFNKEEVLEYLEEMAEDNFQRQEAADIQQNELKRHIQELEEELSSRSSEDMVPYSTLEEQSRNLDKLREDIEKSRAAAQQAETELSTARQNLQTMKQENAWLRQESAKSDKQIALLKKQLEDITGGQWDSAQQEINDLRQQLEEATRNHEADAALQEENQQLKKQLEEAGERIEWLESEAEERGYDDDDTHADHPVSAVERTAAVIIQEAYTEADRIRGEAVAERDRIQRQMRNSTGDLAESVNNLRTEISGMEGDVGDILELVQAVLADVLNSLGRAEQNLHTFGTQIDRFPAASPPVPKPSLLYFQPSQTVKASGRSSLGRRNYDPSNEGAAKGSLRRILPSGTTGASAAALKSFRPSYTAQATARQEVPRVEHTPAPAPDRQEQVRQLADNLVETLLDMLEE